MSDEKLLLLSTVYACRPQKNLGTNSGLFVFKTFIDQGSYILTTNNDSNRSWKLRTEVFFPCDEGSPLSTDRYLVYLLKFSGTNVKKESNLDF